MGSKLTNVYGQAAVASAAEVLRELYPEAYQIDVVKTAARGSLVAFPSPADARLLLPTAGKAAAAGLRHARRPLDRRSKLQSSLAGLALRTGTAQRLMGGFHVQCAAGSDSIERLLESVLGRPVVIGIFLGPKRANRKPVLQVLDDRGDLVAIAKVGLTPLTRVLASTEAAALTELQHRRGTVLTPPELLYYGEWRGHSVLVQSPLDLCQAPINIDPGVRSAAMRELAYSSGVQTTTWAGSSYLARLQSRVSLLARSELVQVMQTVIAWLRERPSSVDFGTWHGDWTAWNMAVAGDRALVWDWERYEHDVPVGFDALHYAFMPALKGRDAETSGLGLLGSAGQILHPFGVAEQVAKEIVISYLMDLAVRYLSDRQADTGVAGGDPAEWLMPVLSTIRIGGVREMDDQHG